MVFDSTSELIEQAKNLLEEQRKRNIAYGTYDTLEQDARELKALRNQIAEAIDKSLSIHPGMEDMLKAIEREYKAIQEKIETHQGKSSAVVQDASTFMLRLLSAIKNIPLDDDAPSEIQKIRAYLEHPQSQLFLQSQELALLKTECDKRLDLWRKVKDTKKPQNADERAVATILNMDRLKGKFHDVTLIIDACNAILCSSKLKALADADNSIAAARSLFLKQCRQKLKGAFKKVMIVFDGVDDINDVYDESSEDDYKVVYAKRQQDAHNADLFILNYLANAKENETCWLVTDDYGLRHEAGDAVEANVETLALHKLLKI